jgi:hypothetical protein
MMTSIAMHSKLYLVCVQHACISFPHIVCISVMTLVPTQISMSVLFDKWNNELDILHIIFFNEWMFHFVCLK